MIAILCLVALGLDVTANCACDLHAGSPTASIVITDDDSGSAGDPCAGSCIPDCCCCAPSLAASDPRIHFVLEPTAAIHPSGTVETITGIAPIPYRPPSALL